MKIGKCFKKIMLFSAVSLVGYISGIQDTTIHTAAAVASMETTQVATGSAITTVETQNVTTLYPFHDKSDNSTIYGYIDQSGQVVIKPKYYIAGDYSDGFAVVYNGKKYQLIDQKGKVVFETDGYLMDFHNGLAAFSDPKNNYQQGYINSKGKVAIKAQYEFAGEFRSDNTAIVKKSGKFYMIDNKGKVQKTYKFNSNKFNVYSITKDGNIIFTDTKTYLQGLVNLDGKVILKPIYGEIKYLGEGLYGVKQESKTEAYLMSIKPAALFNKQGKKLTTYKYYDLSDFSGGYASVTDSKFTYFINKNGNKVTTLPTLEGRGTMKVLGDIIQADIDNELMYMKKDGTSVWKKDETTKLDSGIIVNTVKIRPNKYAVVNYPKLEGMKDSSVQKKVNLKLEEIFTKNRIKLKEKDYLSVCDTFTAKQIDNLLMINREGYDYPFGAAHGIPFSDYFMINVNTGDFYQLKDLFKSDSKYAAKLSKIINKQMKENKDFPYFPGSSDMISKNQSFYLDKETLTIYYSYGEIAANAAGLPEFHIPFQDIMSLINTNGAFWKSFHSK